MCASCERSARILVASGADEHVCPTNFASATPLRLAKGGMLHGAQGHMIEAHGTRTLCTRLGPEGQSVGAELRVTNVRTPILTKKLIKLRRSSYSPGDPAPQRQCAWF